MVEGGNDKMELWSRVGKRDEVVLDGIEGGDKRAG